MEILQCEDLNVIDAMKTMEATVCSLQEVNNDVGGMNAEIEAAASFVKSRSLDPHNDLARYDRFRRPPTRIDGNPESQTKFDMASFYRKEFKAVLDTQISFLTAVISNCRLTIKPLLEC